MNSYTFKCEVQEPLVLFKKSKTEQTTESLDYIPGNTFRGIVAGIVFKNGAEASTIEDLIFNGNVQFGDAQLLIAGKRALNVPASFYYNYKRSDNEQVANFHHMSENDWGEKHKQARDGYFIKDETDGYLLEKVKLGDRMKASRDADTRSSKDGGLFLYRYIEKGQCFEFEVRSENEDYLKQIKEILDGKEYFFGKSKTAEFGGCIKITYQGTAEPELKTELVTYIYAESNLCFLNKYGEFTPTPSVEQLTGNKDAEIDWEKSQLRFRSYYPYNGHRKTWDFERLIIEKGSVFVLKEPIKIDAEHVQKGIGCFVTEGYGRALLDPDFLKVKGLFNLKKHDHDKATPLPPIAPEDKTIGDKKLDDRESTPVGEEKSATYRYLLKKYCTLKMDIDLHEEAEEYIKNNTFSAAITASQWNQVYDAAIRAVNAKELDTILFTSENSICASGSKNPWSSQNKEKLKAFLEKKENKLQAVKILAKKMRFLKKHKREAQ